MADWTTIYWPATGQINTVQKLPNHYACQLTSQNSTHYSRNSLNFCYIIETKVVITCSIKQRTITEQTPQSCSLCFIIAFSKFGTDIKVAFWQCTVSKETDTINKKNKISVPSIQRCELSPFFLSIRLLQKPLIYTIYLKIYTTSTKTVYSFYI